MIKMRLELIISVLIAASVAQVATGAAYDSGEAGDDAEDAEDSDKAPFMVMVVHEEGSSCSGSLVSVRAVLSSRECAARPEPAQWVRALPPAGCASCAAPVRRLALAGAPDDAPAAATAAWAVAAFDLALLELERPLGSDAQARPILLATSRAHCEAPAAATCLVVRSLPPAGRSTRVRLRISDTIVPSNGDHVCSYQAPDWSTVRDRATCLQQPVLCKMDWGAGVVCGGKLCGVVSRSVRAGEPATVAPPGRPPHPAGPEHCGDTHIAQSVPRWREFLRCAHTLRSCGRGDCSLICHEVRLGDEAPTMKTASNTNPPEMAVVSYESSSEITEPLSIESSMSSFHINSNTRHRQHSRTTPLKSYTDILTRTHTTTRQRKVSTEYVSGGMMMVSSVAGAVAAREFEPNRADFRVGDYDAAEYVDPLPPPRFSPTRSTRATNPQPPLSPLLPTDNATVSHGKPHGSLRSANIPLYEEPKKRSGAAIQTNFNLLNLLILTTSFMSI